MKYGTLLACVAASAVTGLLAAQAQVPGVNSTLQSVFTLSYDNSTMKPTYSATSYLAPVASATDICTLSGSATRRVKVRRIIYTGKATAVSSLPVLVVKRSTANTGGTGTVLAKTSYDTSNAAATAAFADIWLTNPTTLGTLTGVLAEVYYTYANLTTGVGQAAYTFNFGALGQPIVLRGVLQSVSVNLAGVTVSGGDVACTIEWTEDND